MTKKLVTALALTLFTGIANAQSTNPAPYCDGSFDDANGFPVSDAIKSVTIGTLTNNSGGQYAYPHYVFYNNLSVPTLTKSNPISMSITFEVHGAAGYGVWIDLNQNNIFEANEKVAGTNATTWLNISNNTVVTPSFTIPATALNGNTRMRVRIVEDDNYTQTYGAAILPCNASTSANDIMDWGETEDYVVNISGGTTGTKPTAAFSANVVTGKVNNTAITFTDNSTNNPTNRSWTFTPNTVSYQNSTSATSANPIVKFTNIGTYSVKLVVSNAAGTDSIIKSNYITITNNSTAISNIDVSEQIALYPNPAKTTVQISETFKGGNLILTDLVGKVCLKLDAIASSTLDISSLQNGVYIVTILQEGQRFAGKLVVTR
ncbi:MAG: T9SS type A sorting domain-containing protein [Bacteroidetes bacterium]|nr:T9SS type A sorting domain-containing protein [Bacteroidota bacterium]MBS1739963.1 T9SS type A sorting domain-containing protein [Bacteroidota bacterium]